MRSILGIRVSALPEWVPLILVMLFFGVSEHLTAAALALILLTFLLPCAGLYNLRYLPLVLVVKIFQSAFLAPSPEYQEYQLDVVSAVREIATVFCFFMFLLFGRFVFTIRIARHFRDFSIACVLLMLVAARTVSEGSIYLHGIDASQATIMFLCFYLLTYPQRLAGWPTVCIILVAFLTHKLLSTFSSLFAICTFGCYVLRLLRLDQIGLKAKYILFPAIALLFVLSLVAESVNVKDERNTEGNNGATRRILALEALTTFEKNPLVGTQLGRGIVPPALVRELDWSQYFNEADSEGSFNIYALSFHNGYLYLLTRYGLLSIFLFWVFFKICPRIMTPPAMSFSLLFLLGIGSNIVIESIRTGPAVALALGILFSVEDAGLMSGDRIYDPEIKVA